MGEQRTRMTYRTRSGLCRVKKVEINWKGIKNPDVLKEAIKLLNDYENTHLTPEQVVNQSKNLKAAYRTIWRLRKHFAEIGKSENVDVLTTEMMEHICDNLCRYRCDVTDETELDEICYKCRMNEYVSRMLDVAAGVG